jgi:antitoxin (DNA-binding transcriptional repressor) of toxin-antitoxin stability system
MEAAAKQINVRLDKEHTRKLAELAAERHVEEVELAGEVLAGALDDFGIDGARMTEILDGIPGAWERTQEGLEQARRGEGVPLDVVRHGRPVATIGPAGGGTGRAVKEMLRTHRPDPEWAAELHELRKWIGAAETKPWRD